MNGQEIGIDCGGPDCDPCPTTGDCTNGLQDGDETYIDCGGSSCPPCEGQITWKANGTLFNGDAEATATMNGTSIVLGGVSLTTAQIGFTIEEPTIPLCPATKIFLFFKSNIFYFLFIA